MKLGYTSAILVGLADTNRLVADRRASPARAFQVRADWPPWFYTGMKIAYMSARRKILLPRWAYMGRITATMDTNQQMKPTDFFDRHPVFRFDDFAAVHAAGGHLQPSSAVDGQRQGFLSLA